MHIADVHLDRVIGVRAAPDMSPTILKCDLNIVDDITLAERVPFKMLPAERV